MITIEGAKLLAQLIPILILVLAVHRQALGPERIPDTRIGKIWYLVKGSSQVLGAGFCLVALVPLFAAVNEQSSIDGLWAVFIFVSVCLVGFAAMSVVQSLVFRGYFKEGEGARFRGLLRRQPKAGPSSKRSRRHRNAPSTKAVGAERDGGGSDPADVLVADRSS